MKRLSMGVLICTLTFLFFCSSALADNTAPSVTTPYICLMDSASGNVLYEKKSTEQAYPASTTKIMTCILVIENCGDLNAVVNVGTDFDTKGSLMGFVRNEEFRVTDLLHGMMLNSGNDAASALAAYVGGSESAFVEMMNQKAAELGMVNTHYSKSNGLHRDDHYTTAYDMALLTKYALKNETFRQIVSTETYDVPASQWDLDGYHLENTNKLIHTKEGDQSYEYAYAIGVKTGDTVQAGRCLVAAAKKDGVELILVLFGDYENAVSTNYRFENAAKFFDWGFSNYYSISATELGLATSLVQPVSNATFDDEEEGKLTLNVDLTGKIIAGLKDEMEDIKANATSIESTCSFKGGALSAPISAGDVVGTITYSYQSTELFSADLLASRDVVEIGSTESQTNSSSDPNLSVEETREAASYSWIFYVMVVTAVLSIFLLIRAIAIRESKRRKRRMRKIRRKRH